MSTYLHGVDGWVLVELDVDLITGKRTLTYERPQPNGIPSVTVTRDYGYGQDSPAPN